MLRRPPTTPLAPYCLLLWACDGFAEQACPRPVREHMLPTGYMHLVFRMNASPLTTFGATSGTARRSVGTAVIAGARPAHYLRERVTPTCSVGAVLRPGAARRLFGISAAELSARHTPLDETWGTAAASMRDRLLEATRCADRLLLLEAMLTARVARLHGRESGVCRTIARMPALASVAEAARQGGLSHRAFIARFRDEVGLAPKRYLRIVRFQQALHAIRGGGTVSLAAHAAQAGYSDQAHLCRDFLELAGVTPREYLRRNPVEANHLPAAAVATATGQIRSRPDLRRP